MLCYKDILIGWKKREVIVFKRSKKKPERNHIGIAGLGVTIGSIYITLVAYATATTFKAGYLSYFGVDIRNVDYWPTIPDLMNQPILVVLAILVLLGLGFLAILAVNGIHWVALKIAEKRKWNKFKDFIDEKPYGWKLTTGILVAFLLFLSIKMPLYDSYDQGIDAAKRQKNFTIIVSESSEKQVLIYQYADVGIFKTYDNDTESFAESYDVIDMTGLRLQAVKLTDS